MNITKNNYLVVNFCSVCKKPISLDGDICCQNMDITKNGTLTIAAVFFHPECAGEYYRRFPEKKDGAE